MISFIAGTHLGMEDDGALCIGVAAGIGYRVVVNDRDRKTINANEVGSHVKLHCRTRQTEDETIMFGFLSLDDRRAFDRLLKVDGIGPSTALRLLSMHDAAGLGELVRRADVKALTKVPGIGTRTAEKLCVEARL